jgi:predicted DNA-binding protein
MEKVERKLVNMRLPVTTVEKLKRLAASEHRPVANYVYVLIERQPEPDKGGEGSQK